MEKTTVLSTVQFELCFFRNSKRLTCSHFPLKSYTPMFFRWDFPDEMKVNYSYIAWQKSLSLYEKATDRTIKERVAFVLLFVSLLWLLYSAHNVTSSTSFIVHLDAHEKPGFHYVRHRETKRQGKVVKVNSSCQTDISYDEAAYVSTINYAVTQEPSSSLKYKLLSSQQPPWQFCEWI